MDIAAGRWIDVVVGSLWFSFASEVVKVGGSCWGFQEMRECMK